MVYVYAKKSFLNKYIGKELSIEEIELSLKDLGLDVKGQEILENLDIELKVELTAEKLDMISPLGIARAIKYYKGFSTQINTYNIEDSKFELIIDKSAKESRPKVVAAILKNVPMNQELLDEMIEIQEKIHESFGRGRKKAAIGIYPLENIKFPIIYSSENPNLINFRPLGKENSMNALEILEKHDTGRKYAHLLKDYSKYPIFKDANSKILSMPPIINSHDTGKVEIFHRDLFIECSGYNIQLLDNILKVLLTTFMDMGAKAQSIKVKYEDEIYQVNLNNIEDEISLNYVNSLIGIQIDSKTAQDLLKKVQYGIKNIQGDKILVQIPPYRSDIWSDVDIADDIARAYGYNNIEARFPSISSIGENLPFSKFKENFSENLVSMGFLENYTYILSSSQRQFDKILLDKEKESYEKLIDSADQGINMTRTRIFPELLEALHLNRKNKYPQKIFENGFTIQIDKKNETGAKNNSKISVIIADPKSNYTQIKGVLDTILKLNSFEFEIKKSEEIFLIEGRRGNIFIDDINLGFIGELDPKILENFGLLVPISLFELDLDLLFKSRK